MPSRSFQGQQPHRSTDLQVVQPGQKTEQQHRGGHCSPVRGGSESYFAYAADQEERIESGTRVVVLEHEAARTVIVSPLA